VKSQEEEKLPLLQPQLDEHRSKSIAEIPPDILAVAKQATEELIRSGIAERALQKGEKAPDFVLPDTSGRNVALSDLLAGGPVVLAFYRGVW
jgi:hypothetical protein